MFLSVQGLLRYRQSEKDINKTIKTYHVKLLKSTISVTMSTIHTLQTIKRASNASHYYDH